MKADHVGPPLFFRPGHRKGQTREERLVVRLSGLMYGVDRVRDWCAALGDLGSGWLGRIGQRQMHGMVSLSLEWHQHELGTGL